MRTSRIIKLTIETGNAAFDDCERGEVAKQLRAVARSFANGETDGIDSGVILDSNGHTCGHLHIAAIK